MPRRPVASSLPLILLFALLSAGAGPGCKKDEAPPPEPVAEAPQPVTAAAPTKEEVVALLRTVDARLSEQNYEGMDALFGVPTGFSAEQLAENLAGLQERGRSSAQGIDALSARGTFGPAVTVLGPDRAGRYAAKFGVGADACHALAQEPGEVVVCRFPDGALRIIRLDDVGRLQ